MSEAGFRPRVLVADDSAVQRACVRDELKSLNVEIAEAEDGIAALKMTNRFRPDLITLDIEMPVLNGYRVLDQLRSQEPTMTLPVIMISGRPSEAERLRALEAGAIEYFTKPFPRGELSVLVADVLARLAANRETRIYCIDSAENVRRQIAIRIQTHGYQCRTFADTPELIAALGEASCDVVLLDLHLPAQATYQVLDHLKREPRHQSTAVIGLTRCGVRKDLVNAFQLGVQDFIRKPFYGEELLARIDHLMEVKRFQSNLERIAAVDPLTALPNRGELNRRFDIEVARALRDKNQLGLLMVDIDHFKRINDSKGHPCGDRVLSSVARVLSDELRLTDVIGRYGGEEFLIVLPNAMPAGMLQLAERLRRAVENLRVEFGGEFLGVTVSVGGCLWRDQELAQKASRDTLVQPADSALYRAKNAGRNRVCFAESVPESVSPVELGPASRAFLTLPGSSTGTTG
jgi:diguanylate cyclase (GGDEF)-like protein